MLMNVRPCWLFALIRPFVNKIIGVHFTNFIFFIIWKKVYLMTYDSGSIHLLQRWKGGKGNTWLQPIPWDSFLTISMPYILYDDDYLPFDNLLLTRLTFAPFNISLPPTNLSTLLASCQNPWISIECARSSAYTVHLFGFMPFSLKWENSCTSIGPASWSSEYIVHPFLHEVSMIDLTILFWNCRETGGRHGCWVFFLLYTVQCGKYYLERLAPSSEFDYISYWPLIYY